MFPTGTAAGSRLSERNTAARLPRRGAPASAPAPWASLTDRVAPGQRVIWDGQTWRNTSGAWLPTTATPATWPQGWAQETGLPPTITAWASGQAVKINNLRTYGGKTYRCIQAHTTQTGWEPPSVPALWTLQG